MVPACLAVVLLLQFHLVLTRAINWDEFWYYSLVEQFARGSLTNPLQTIHVRLFGWLTGLPGNGVDHIVVGRMVMFAAEMATLAAIWAISAHFTDRRTGLLCVLAYVGSHYVFQHGYSFRVDPLSAGLSMTALLVLLKGRPGPASALAFAVLLGLAGMVTIKTALLAPAFAGVAWLRLAEAEHRGKTLAWLAMCALGTVLAFAALYLLHSRMLANASTDVAASTVRSAGTYAIRLGLPDYASYVRYFAIKSPLQTLLIVAAPFAIARSRLPGSSKIALLGMLATALVFFVYQNALPYFYAFILPPIICAAALVVQASSRRYPVAFIAVALALGPGFSWAREPASPIDKQRLIVDAAEQIFPEPVAYFDFCAMLGTFRKANPFMTTWGMQAYRDAGVPVMRRRMERQVVPLLLASEQESYPTFREMLASDGPSPYFLDEDAAALRDNYLPFWGPYWLAGKAVPADGTVRATEFLVPGPYTVRDADVTIDGVSYGKGEVVRIERGVHRLQAKGGRSARLIWGERLQEPPFPLPAPPYWTDF